MGAAFGSSLDPDEAMRSRDRPGDPAARQPARRRAASEQGAINDLQRRLVDETRLGIPAICHEECLTGYMAQGATSFASPLNYGATWDPGAHRAGGRRDPAPDASGRRAPGPCAGRRRGSRRAVGSHRGDGRRGPVSGRHDGQRVRPWPPRGRSDHGHHRNAEALRRLLVQRGAGGTSPRHTSDDASWPTCSCCRSRWRSRRAGAGSVMNSYQEIDGEQPAASRWLLTEVLRDQWGFDGFVVADYGAVTFLHAFAGAATDGTEASAQAADAPASTSSSPRRSSSRRDCPLHSIVGIALDWPTSTTRCAACSTAKFRSGSVRVAVRRRGRDRHGASRGAVARHRGGAASRSRC